VRDSGGEAIFIETDVTREDSVREYAAIKFFLLQFQRYPFSVGDPEDLHGLFFFLASDDAHMITGAILPADGGPLQLIS
jgi:NAD(P)-dependent dehydrogenase (short-subunit alcohol dehydrogenase family)